MKAIETLPSICINVSILEEHLMYSQKLEVREQLGFSPNFVTYSDYKKSFKLSGVQSPLLKRTRI